MHDMLILVLPHLGLSRASNAMISPMPALYPTRAHPVDSAWRLPLPPRPSTEPTLNLLGMLVVREVQGTPVHKSCYEPTLVPELVRW